ncbi:hypothetical protein B0H14DRAFT_3504313 [Mycena olivaceomarginata]|nr:hypothetical protein B0H14DRAFT_3504313 [Mycena olivaceomarginata]
MPVLLGVHRAAISSPHSSSAPPFQHCKTIARRYTCGIPHPRHHRIAVWPYPPRRGLVHPPYTSISLSVCVALGHCRAEPATPALRTPCTLRVMLSPRDPRPPHIPSPLQLRISPALRLRRLPPPRYTSSRAVSTSVTSLGPPTALRALRPVLLHTLLCTP